MTDAETPHEYAFDNPGFREATPIKQDFLNEKQTSMQEKKEWFPWAPIPFGKKQKGEKITSVDDSYAKKSIHKVVMLKSHDFTGLGFNICGNMKDGIFVKDVLHRGPAFESGCINSGDRIDSVCINFRHMVYEDALTILSYASPYDVQVRVEQDSYWRPSTLIRSKREVNAISSPERIQHPMYRSHSISHVNEIRKSHNKKTAHFGDFTMEKNRMNQTLNKSQNYLNSSEYPTLKLSVSHGKKENQKLQNDAAPTSSPMTANKKFSSLENKKKDLEFSSEKTSGGDPQNKLQKFGIKVLPISMNPKMGIQSMTGTKKPKEEGKNFPEVVNGLDVTKEKQDKPKLQGSRSVSPSSNDEESDPNKDHAKGILSKGLQNLKEKINQNSLGKKKFKDSSKENIFNAEENSRKSLEIKSTEKNEENSLAADCPVPKLRSTVTCGVKAYEKSQQSHLQMGAGVPEEVSKAGDVARNNRKSITELPARKLVTSIVADSEDDDKVILRNKNRKVDGSDSDGSSDRDSFQVTEEEKKPKKSKGKAPPPPQNGVSPVAENKPVVCLQSSVASLKVNEIKKESELPTEEKEAVFEPVSSEISESSGVENARTDMTEYESDSDSEIRPAPRKGSHGHTKIELKATEVTIHQSSPGDALEEDKEPSRKAASLGDLSKLDSEQPLSLVLERAVSLDLTDGSSQCGKKRKAPLPPSEEFPAVFEDYRKEPRLDHSLGVSTFQPRLKKSSDFGTLEDVFNEGPRSLEIEVNKHVDPLNLTETYNSNIQEFSSWLAECRRPKKTTEETPEDKSEFKGSTSLVNISSFDSKENEKEVKKPMYEYGASNFCFSVNGKNFPDIEVNEKSDLQNVGNFPGVNSKTVVVISQPNSLEPVVLETMVANSTKSEKPETMNDSLNISEKSPLDSQPETEPQTEHSRTSVYDEEALPPKLPTSPIPATSGTLSSPLSTSLTYITEIKVSTLEQEEKNDSVSTKELQILPSKESENEPHEQESISDNKIEFTTSIREKIEKFDRKSSFSPNNSNALRPKSFTEDSKSNLFFYKTDNYSSSDNSKIPIRAMKSETGQKVLATIQSLAAKESLQQKSPEVEYARRVASILSGNDASQKNQNDSLQAEVDEEIPPTSFSNGLYLKGPGTSPPKPSKDYSPTRKVPPVVPPRKLETSLSSKSTVTVELPSSNQGLFGDTQERSKVTFSSFTPYKSDKPGSPSQSEATPHPPITLSANLGSPTKTKIFLQSKHNKMV